MATSPVLRGIVCPIVTTPECLSVTVGDRGTENAGRLVMGITVAPQGGIICSDTGLALDVCIIQQNQFKSKSTTVFSTGTIYTQGLV